METERRDGIIAEVRRAAGERLDVDASVELVRGVTTRGWAMLERRGRSRRRLGRASYPRRARRWAERALRSGGRIATKAFVVAYGRWGRCAKRRGPAPCSR